MDLSNRLRELRARNDMSMGQLAVCSGLARSFIFALERSGSSPTLDTIEKLSEAFDMTVLEFLEPLYAMDEPAFPLAV